MAEKTKKKLSKAALREERWGRAFVAPPFIGFLITIGRGCAARKHLCKMGLVVLFSGIH